MINQKLGRVCKFDLRIRTHRRREAIHSPVLAKLRELGYNCCDIRDKFFGYDGLITTNDLPAGATIMKINKARRKASCLYPMAYMTIMPDGRVLSCGSMDVEESTRIGHLDNSTLMEIWQGPELRAFRCSFTNGKLYSVCKSCGKYMNYETAFSRPGLKNFDPSSNLLAACISS